MKRYYVNEPNQKIAPVIKILLTLSFAIILAGICYLLFITLFINPWLENNQRELCVLNFYSHKNTSTVPEVYFLGTSQIKEGLDCYTVEDTLKKSNSSFNCYNLAVNADSPLRRLIELNALISSKPEIVVIGTDIRTIYSEGEIDASRLMLVSGRVVLDNTSTHFFNSKNRELLNSDLFTRDISNRIYIIGYLNYMTLNKISPNSFGDYAYRNNFKNPYQDVKNLTIEEKIEKMNQYDPVNDTLFSHYYGDSINKHALQYTIQELQKNNISVIIIDMPMDPLSSKKISNTTRDNYLSYVTTLGVPYYDFQRKYPSSYFHDLSHMNIQGRTVFSEDIAQIIKKEADK
ncbi:MAG: hypothetical protein M0Q91_12425 [Methanoregula sp.]|jgi:hypothetical protein|nr:hypothetical protein [Methanoregula sp.]